MKGLYTKFLRKLAHIQTTHPYLSLLLLFVLTVAISSLIPQVRTVASLEQMMPTQVEEIKAFNALRDNGLGQDMIAIVMQIDKNSALQNGIIDLRDKRVYEYISGLEKELVDQTDVLEVFSYSKIINYYASRNEIHKIDDNTYSEILLDDSIKSQMSDYVNDDYSVSIMLLTTDVSADDPRMKLLSEKVKDIVDSYGHPIGVEILFTGTPVIQQKLGELIEKDRNDTKNISTLLVFLITMFIFGTFTSALVPIIVVTVSVNFLYGTMGYFDLPISTMAGGVAAMVVGIGIDFAIHIMNKFKYERKKGLSIKQSVEEAIVETGTALTATSITTISAFLAFLVGAMPEMGRFGILMAMGIIYALIFSVFGLPALLVVEEKLIYIFKKKARFGVEAELHLESSKEIKVVDKKGKVV